MSTDFSQRTNGDSAVPHSSEGSKPELIECSRQRTFQDTSLYPTPLIDGEDTIWGFVDIICSHGRDFDGHRLPDTDYVLAYSDGGFMAVDCATPSYTDNWAERGVHQELEMDEITLQILIEQREKLGHDHVKLRTAGEMKTKFCQGYRREPHTLGGDKALYIKSTYKTFSRLAFCEECARQAIQDAQEDDDDETGSPANTSSDRSTELPFEY